MPAPWPFSRRLGPCLVLLLALAACGRRAVAPETGWRPVAEEDLVGTRADQHARALAARDALLAGLMGRLVSAMAADGPAGAIGVCREEAPRIAAEVGSRTGVWIGRTAERLRSPANAPRPWAVPYVALRPEAPVWLAHEDGRLAALLPIRLQARCLVCHGGPGDVPAAVTARLAELYPGDRATGFAEGDLRGWVQVEVPALP